MTWSKCRDEWEKRRDEREARAVMSGGSIWMRVGCSIWMSGGSL